MNNFLFFDIDGTLVTSDNRIPKSAWDAIETCRKNGDYVFLCSGRTKSSAESFERPYMEGTIYCSGAGIYSKTHGTVLFPIPTDDVMEMKDELEKLNCGVMIFCTDYMYGNDVSIAHMVRFGKEYGNHSAEEVLGIYRVKRLDQYTGDPILKMDVYFPDQSACDVFCKKYLKDSAIWQRMSDSDAKQTTIYGEINPKNVSKGTGVEKIVEMYGGKMENTYGFGDSMNDAEMVKSCAHGIAMGNGITQLKELADHVTDDVEKDGVAKALKYYGLI